MYLGKSGCILTTVAVFGQNGLYSGKSYCIREKVAVSGRGGCIRAKVVVFG